MIQKLPKLEKNWSVEYRRDYLKMEDSPPAQLI